MWGKVSLPAISIGVVGLALVGMGVVYLTVACQSLPRFLGPVHGDTSPRTALGVVWVALGLMALACGFLLARRHSRG
jgi:drug/metabolite transporter (DMT)-like permease